ncbi:MAG: histidine phosphatase family protein [Acidobacteria bacterium]|nr:MAG: histidine phosphatase family protein [Acidobacteriota bacterium]
MVSTVYLVRHAETEWSTAGRHTGLTDLPLTERGEAAARRIGERLRAMTFNNVYTSPLQRGTHTCELARFGSRAEIDADLVEWNYGLYEGKVTADILADRPDWDLFRDGCPEGESPAEVAGRASRFLKRLEGITGNVLLFSHGHFLRVLATEWLRVPTIYGTLFQLSAGSVSSLGHDNRTRRVMLLWNETSHLRTGES